ncbi:VOC family protein [Aeromicrobium massiliense]|uniref:VOC family protein n=1 Tax=Aeromicrobium massiliense TaxID=1464554 RepID=UPI0002D2DBE1|nr:VOC family protein [Aeromicrobium massiliense]
MTARLDSLAIDAADPDRLAAFWGGLLGWSVEDDASGAPIARSDDGSGLPLRFPPSSASRTGLNRIHLHLTSTSLDDRDARIATALRLGGRHLDVGQLPEETHVVLADPEGNELCVIEPGNRWLAGCGLLGELACDGTRATGVFWSEALGWPLVWDEDGETAIRSPRGDFVMAWGGEPLNPKRGTNRLRPELVADDLDAEAGRLEALGARRSLPLPGTDGVVLLDPDDNELVVRAAG